MERAYRPLVIEMTVVGGFVAVAVVLGQDGWGTPADNEPAIGAVSRWCERVSGGFLREPVNTLGNLGFVATGLAMFAAVTRESAAGKMGTNRFVGNTPISLLYASAVVPWSGLDADARDPYVLRCLDRQRLDGCLHLDPIAGESV